MIAADRFRDNGDGTAWWVVSSPVDATVALDRTCDTCSGAGRYDVVQLGEVFGWQYCTDCDGTGRHTFIVDVQGPPPIDFVVDASTLRVHVIDVLPIIDEDDLMNGTHTVCLIDPHGAAHVLDGVAPHPITLPPAAKPGMWLVRLAVHE